MKKLLRYKKKKLDLTELPTEIFQYLKHVSNLNLSSNKLKELPQDFYRCFFKVRELNLQRNELSVLSPSIGNFTSLQTLSIKDLSSLKNLIINRNLELEVIPEEIFHLPLDCKVYGIDYCGLSESQVSIINKKPMEIGYHGPQFINSF